MLARTWRELDQVDQALFKFWPPIKQLKEKTYFELFFNSLVQRLELGRTGVGNYGKTTVLLKYVLLMSWEIRYDTPGQLLNLLRPFQEYWIIIYVNYVKRFSHFNNKFSSGKFNVLNLFTWISGTNNICWVQIQFYQYSVRNCIAGVWPYN